MRQIAIDQKLKENPQPAAAIVHTVNPTPISLKGLMLQMQREKKKKQISMKYTRFYLLFNHGHLQAIILFQVPFLEMI